MQEEKIGLFGSERALLWCGRADDFHRILKGGGTLITTVMVRDVPDW